MRAVGGLLAIDGTGETVFEPDGVTTLPGHFRPTDTCDAGLAEKLAIPVGYLRRLRQEHLDLWDANVNGSLQRDPGRSFLIRALRGDLAEIGIARAVLSERYRFVDNLEVLLAVLAGMHAVGVEVAVGPCDLTERRMYVQISSPAVAALAPDLLRGYVSPFTGDRGAENPTVFAGFILSNSETGHGSFSITPRLVVQICRNGLTITKDAMREVHLGGRLDAGVVAWSEGIQRAAVELITRQAADAVRTFLNPDYLTRTLADIQSRAVARVHDAQATIRYVSTQLRFTDEQQRTILEHYIAGADRTAGGILQAVTSAAQVQPDADTAYEMERTGLRAMDLAAAHQR